MTTSWLDKIKARIRDLGAKPPPVDPAAPDAEAPEEEQSPRGLFGPWWAAIQAELRKQLVSNIVKLIIAIPAALFFALGGYVAYDKYQAWQDRQQNYHTVCMDGRVLDAYEGEVVKGALVSVVGDPAWVDTSKSSGYFRICINIPKSQRYVDIIIESPGYIRQRFNQQAVPDNAHARENFPDYNLTSVKYGPNTSPLDQ